MVYVALRPCAMDIKPSQPMRAMFAATDAYAYIAVVDAPGFFTGYHAAARFVPSKTSSFGVITQ
jgi:hypothetical protein